MAYPNTYVQDIELLSRGLIPVSINDILIDRELEDSAIIRNLHNEYLKRGKFSDLIKSDLNYVYRNKSPQLRPIISSLGGGKSTLLVQIENIAHETYKNKAVVIKINMSAYPGMDEGSLKKYVFREIFIKMRPYLKEMLTEAGDSFYLPFLNPSIIRDLKSDSKDHEEEAFQRLIGEIQTPNHDFNYFQINGAKEFLIEIFKKSNRLLVLMFDEVDMFVRANKTSHESTIDIFTYIFLRDMTDPGIEQRPFYVVFTSEKEMYEYIRAHCQNFQRVADTHEILMKEFNDKELKQLADNIFNRIISPLFGRKANIRQMPDGIFQNMIVDIRTSMNNKMTPGNFTKHYINNYLDYSGISFDLISNVTGEYEEMAFHEFERVVRQIDPGFTCQAQYELKGHMFDAYAELLKKSTPVVRVYGEFTMSEANTEKVDKFIHWINDLIATNDFDEAADLAMFISPAITEHAMMKLEHRKIRYQQLDNTTINIKWLAKPSQLQHSANVTQKANLSVAAADGMSAAAGANVPDIGKTDHEEVIRKMLRAYGSWKKMSRVVTELLSKDPYIAEAEIYMVINKMREEGLITVKDKKIGNNSIITFKNVRK